MPPSPIEPGPELPRQAQTVQYRALVQRALDDMMPWEGEEVKCACRLVEGALPLLPVEVSSAVSCLKGNAFFSGAHNAMASTRCT